MLRKGRDKFPILPPFVELTYIGKLAGVPMKAATEFHTSSATETDLACTLRYAQGRG